MGGCLASRTSWGVRVGVGVQCLRARNAWEGPAFRPFLDFPQNPFPRIRSWMVDPRAPARGRSLTYTNSYSSGHRLQLSRLGRSGLQGPRARQASSRYRVSTFHVQGPRPAKCCSGDDEAKPLASGTADPEGRMNECSVTLLFLVSHRGVILGHGICLPPIIQMMCSWARLLALLPGLQPESTCRRTDLLWASQLSGFLSAADPGDFRFYSWAEVDEADDPLQAALPAFQGQRVFPLSEAATQDSRHLISRPAFVSPRLLDI